MELISLKSIYKIYNVGGEEVRALDGVDLSINNNEYLSIMGPSGSGKSTLANAVEHALFKKGVKTYTLDGDNIRRGINKNLGFSREDRLENLRRIAEIAKLMVETGLVVNAAFISPLISDRELVREDGPSQQNDLFWRGWALSLIHI